SFFLVVIPVAWRSTLFPYTTLFRSLICMGDVKEAERIWEEMTFSKVMDVDDNWMERFFQKEVTVRELIKELMSCLKDGGVDVTRSEEHTSELQSRFDLVCRLLLEKK